MQHLPMYLPNIGLVKALQFGAINVEVIVIPTDKGTSPLATLVGAIFSVWHNISGAIFCYAT